jgi:Fur family transcriptional regulator, ferric uptake regulator
MIDRPRTTRQRTAVSDALNEAEGFSSAQELHERIRATGSSVGLTTVYRALQGLAAAGEADVIIREDGEAAYRKCSERHHHHLVCRDCGRTIEVEGPAVERWADAVSAEHGFSDVSHTLEIFGRCSSCTAG